MACLEKSVTIASPVDAFLASIETAIRLQETAEIVALLREITGEAGVMWAASIVGFGIYSYQYESGRTGTMPTIGFSPRKAQLTFYGLDLDTADAQVLSELGPYTRGKGCLYIKSLAAIDKQALRSLFSSAWNARAT